MKNSNHAIVKVSVCGIFAEPTFKSEMVNQALISEQVQIIDKKDSWYKVQLDSDGYKGWIHEMYFSDISPLNESFNPEMFVRFPIIQTAFQMIGKPYVWGGRSSNGYDCSGLIQTTMNILGVDFPRDAKDQVDSKLLYEVKFQESLESDIAFFEENNIVSHVGILISASEVVADNLGFRFFMIHSSGMVKISEVKFDNSLYAFIDGKHDKKIKLHKIMRFKEDA